MTISNINSPRKLITYGGGQPWSSTITYSFLSHLPTYYGPGNVPTGFVNNSGNALFYSPSDFSAITNGERQIFARAFDSVSFFTNAVFVSVSSGAGNINLGGLRTAQMTQLLNADGTLATDAAGNPVYREVPGYSLRPTATLFATPFWSQFAGDFWLTGSYRLGTPWASSATDDMRHVYHVIPHQLGHSLGLSHSFRDSGPGDIFGVGPNSGEPENNHKFSIMSYDPQRAEGRFASEYQIYDIAALQSAYGRSDKNLGTLSVFDETLFGVNRNRMFSIWSGSGTDRIDASAYAQSAYIDLRPGYFSSIGPKAFADNGALFGAGEIKSNFTVSLGTGGSFVI